MLISTAYAQGTGMFDQSALVQFLPLVLIFVVFYFLLIRPQQRKAKDHRAMLDALRRGDRVVTGGGIIGTVARVDSPEEVEVDIADGCAGARGAQHDHRACSPSPTRPRPARPPSRRRSTGKGGDQGVTSRRTCDQALTHPALARLGPPLPQCGRGCRAQRGG